MNYKYVRLTAYNEKPGEDNSFNVDCRVEDMTQNDFFTRVLKPAGACLFGKMIPEMPSPKANMEKFLAWERKWIGMP